MTHTQLAHEDCLKRLTMTSPPPSDRDRQAIMRILDANANRASEGLRAMEETARFILNARFHTQRLKCLRHELAATLGRLPRVELLDARNARGDVGTTVSTDQERERVDVPHIVAAAAGRTQQAMRCLEEYGKTIDVTFSAEIEQLRYRCYDVCAQLEKACLHGSDRLRRLQTARLYALIDAGDTESKMLERIRRLANAGVDIIQLRDSGVNDRTLYERAVAGARIAGELGVLWIINDRADIAAASGADGVHVGQDELPVEQARRIVGAGAIVGLSTHDMDQVREAANSTVDYIGCGPVFPGSTKKFDEFPGCDFLRQVTDEMKNGNSSQSPLVAFAIGGITSANVSDVVAAGFGRVAVTAALRDGCEADSASALRSSLQKISISDQ